MREELDRQLRKDFPVLFQRMDRYGFSCGDGWYDIIRECAKKLSALDPTIVAEQVKEKFGTLRFYIDQGSDAAYTIIDEAEHKSEVTCDVCGAPGITRPIRSWLSTKCDTHWAEASGEKQNDKTSNSLESGV